MSEVWSAFKGGVGRGLRIWAKVFWSPVTEAVVLTLVIAWLAAMLLGCGDPFTADLFGDATNAGGVGGADAQTSTSGAAGASQGGAASTGGATSVSAGVGGHGAGDGGGGAGAGLAGNGGSGGGGAGGSPDACGPATCVGCCDEQGRCRQGAVDAECGAAGAACQACDLTCGWAPVPGEPGFVCPGVQQTHCVAGVCKKPADYTEGWCCPSGQVCGGAGECS